MMAACRICALFILLILFGGCTRPPDLADIVIHVANTDEFGAFRSQLGARFTPEQLLAFDTALQELRLDAMNRNVPTAAARETDLLSTINGKTVHTVEILGWQARQRRILGEIALLAPQLEHDLKRRDETAATGTPQIVTNRIQNVQDILGRLKQDLVVTEQRLTGWGAMPAAKLATDH